MLEMLNSCVLPNPGLYKHVAHLSGSSSMWPTCQEAPGGRASARTVVSVGDGEKPGARRRRRRRPAAPRLRGSACCPSNTANGGFLLLPPRPLAATAAPACWPSDRSGQGRHRRLQWCGHNNGLRDPQAPATGNSRPRHRSSPPRSSPSSTASTSRPCRWRAARPTLPRPQPPRHPPCSRASRRWLPAMPPWEELPPLRRRRRRRRVS
jgi:hypothetical protein